MSHSSAKTRALGAALLAAVAIAGCSSAAKQDPTADWSQERLYQEGKRNMELANFLIAIDYFETLEARYPFSPLALQAQLDIAYAYYRFGEDESAIAAADRFVKLHPTHEAVAYAHYLRGLVRYNRGNNFLSDVFPRDMARADPQRLRRAFDDFRAVAEQFPDSEYAADARKRMIYLRNEMARHELEVAQFYFKRSAYAAAINRIDYLMAHFDGAPTVPDALALQARAYERLGMADMAHDTRRVLAANWPDHPGLGPENGSRRAALEEP